MYTLSACLLHFPLQLTQSAPPGDDPTLATVNGASGSSSAAGTDAQRTDELQRLRARATRLADVVVSLRTKLKQLAAERLDEPFAMAEYI